MPGLADEFLAEKRGLCGPQTANNYEDRLAHVLTFSELPVHRKKWPLARDRDRVFATLLRGFLFDRDVTRNGRRGAATKKMSPRMVRECLETLKGMLNWAARGDVRKLPPEFVNPISADILGPKPSKDPLRICPLPLDQRIEIVKQMDPWQLLHLSPLLVLATRFEDVSGAIISDFDMESGTWRLGSRFDGNDFDKGQVNVQMPLPPVLSRLLKQTANGRSDGPMFRGRQIWIGKKCSRKSFCNLGEFHELCERAFRNSKSGEATTVQGRKKVVRKLLNDCGSTTTDEVSRELKKLMRQIGIGADVPPYQVRGAVTTDMNRAGIQQLELRYLTMHSATDILNEYTTLNPVAEMQKYFQLIEPLLRAIGVRAKGLGMQIE